MAPAARTVSSAGTGQLTPRLDDFLAALRDNNPFTANRVTEPSSYDVDVPAIHAKAFDRLTSLAGRVPNERAGIGAVLLGGAGAGKSHLLSRLYRWAREAGPDGGPRACYVYLHNILADPDRLPRYLLKYVVSRLSDGGRGPLHQTPLYRFVERAIRHAAGAAGARLDNAKEIQDAYRACFGHTAGGREAFEVLFQFFRYARPEKAAEPARRRMASEAIAWLSGDEIDPEAARLLGLKANDQAPAMLHDDGEVEQVLLTFTQLAHVSNQPLILCVDQVDNLDPDKLKCLVRFLHALLDKAANLLVIVSGVKQTLLEYRSESVIPEAAWDRIAQYSVELLKVSESDARKILEARLERFHEPFMELEAVRRHVQEDTLFPLGRQWMEDRFGGVREFRPREVLNWARDAWEDEQAKLARLGNDWIKHWPDTSTSPQPAPPPPREPSAQEIEAVLDETVERKMAEQVALHRLHPGSLPPDAGNLAGLVESLLADCRGDSLPYTFRNVERMKKKAGKLPPYDLLVREHRESDGREVTTGVLFVTNAGLSATAALRRLLEDDKPPDHRLLVTDHERRPLKVGPQGVEYYRDLEKLGPSRFEHLKIDFERYAGLDALREAIGMAKSGDLEVEIPPGTNRPVSDAEVVASHHRRDRFRGHPLLRPLLTEDPLPVEPGPPDKVALDEAAVRQYVMAQLAWQMGSTAFALAKGYVGMIAAQGVTAEAAWPRLKTIAEGMHADGLVHAQPLDNDLYLLLRK